MSFGTGHHPTTYLMMEQMESIDFKNKSVFDFGTGTGVLAILAKKLGAIAVLAIDNDEWSINNAQENVAMNHCSTITLALGECPPEIGAFDIILANITLNVISAHINALVGVAKKGAAFVFSGFLYTDEAKISAVLKQAGLTVQSFHRRGDWLTAAAIY
jgi:ribosomal protein L11 methyltransferase